MKSVFRRRLASWLVVWVLAAMMVSGSFAANYFVRTSGNNANNGTSPSTAFATLAKAATVAKAGDTVYVGAGTYTGTVAFTFDGTSDNPIKYVADTSGIQTGDSGTVTVTSSGGPVFDFNSVDHIQIIGFRVTGSSASAGAKLTNSKSAMIWKCQFESVNGNAISMKDSGALILDCIATSSNGNAFHFEKSSFIVTNCLIQNANGHGIYSKEISAGAISHTTIVKCTSDGINHDSGDLFVYGSILASNNGKGFQKGGGNLYHNYNLLHGNSSGNFSGVSQASKEIVADPKFLSASDFRLQSNSPAVDSGTNLLVKWDLDGNNRPAGANYDMGCYETPGGAGGSILNEYFVRVTGNDNNSGTSPLSAFRTIRKAAIVAKAGNKVHVGAGTYNDDVAVSNSGTAGKPIEFIADKLGVRTLDAGPVLLSGSSASFQVKKKDYIHVTGFVFGGTKDSGSGSPEESESVGGSAVVEWSDCIGGLMKDCEFQNSGDGLRVSSAELSLDTCNIHDQGGNGIVTSGTTKLTIFGTTIRKCDLRGLYIRRATSVSVEQSTIADNGNHGVRSEAHKSTDSLTMRRCQIAGNAQDGFHFHNKGSVLLENCTIVQNGGEGIQIHSGDPNVTVNYCTIAYNGSDGIDREIGTGNVTNSIVAFNQGDGFHVSGGNVNHSHNLVFGSGDQNYDGTSAGTGEIQQDPKFVSSSDFHLQANSPAVDKGGKGSPVSNDLDGTVRPMGSNPDWGAYEYPLAINPPDLPAKVYYVRVGGNDTKDGKSPATAFRTITKAVSVANRPGVTVHVGGGSYPETVVMDLRGSTGNPIEFLGDVAGTKTGDAGNVVATALTATNCQFVTIDAIQWSNVSGTAAFVDNSTMTFTNCKFSGAAYSLATNKGHPVFDKCTVSGGTTAGLQTTLGTITFNNGTVTGARRGANIDQGQLLAANSSFQNCTEYGLAVTGTGTITDCRVVGNQSGAFLTGAAQSSDITITNTLFDGMSANGLVGIRCSGDILGSGPGGRLTSGGDYGVFLEQSSVVVKNATISGPKYGVHSTSSTAELRDSSISSCTVNGVYVKGGACTVANTTVKACVRGVFFENTNGTATTCTIEQCSEWGLYHTGQGSVNGCIVKDNGSGAFLVGNTVRGDIRITDLVVQNAASNGVHAVRCTGTLIAGSDKVAKGGTYGVFLDDSAITMANLQISGTTYGIQSKTSDLILQNATISNCTRGADFTDTTATVSNCKFEKCTDWAYAHSGKGTISDCELDANNQGAYLIGAAARGDIVLSNLKIQNCTSNGLSATRCTGSIVAGTGPLTTGGSYGAFLDDSDVTFTKPVISNTANGVEAVNSVADVQNAVISGCSANGVTATGGETKLTSCTVSSCHRGVNVENGKATVANSTFKQCADWGYYHTGTGSLQDCLVDANKFGAYLVGAAARGDITLTNLTVQNSTDNGLSATRCTGTVLGGTGPITTGGTYGAYLNDSGVTLTSPTVTKAQFGIQAYSSSVTVTGGTISSCPTTGIYASGGETTISNSTVSLCARGVSIENGQGTTVGSRFETCTDWGYVHSGTGSIQDCVVDGNQFGASFTGASVRGDITIANLQLQNTKSHGLMATRCTGNLVAGTGPVTTGGDYGLYFDDSDMKISGLQVSGSKNGIQAYDSVIDAQAMVLSGCSSNGVYASAGETKLTNCSVTSCGRGAHIEDGMATVVATRFENCSDWGYVHSGTGSVADCTIKNNRFGVYATGKAQTGDITITNSVVDGIRESALYVTRCEGDVKGAGGKSTTEGAYGVYAVSSKMTVSTFDISGSNYGIYSAFGDMTILDTKVSNHATAAVYAYDNTRFDLHGARIFSCPGVAFNQYAGKATLTNCLVFNNAYGMFTRNGEQSRVYNCTFVNNDAYGLWHYSGDADVKNTVVVGSNLSGTGLLKSSGNLTHSHNLVHGYGVNFAGLTPVKSETTDNPRFANAAAGDYRLAMGSPAISSGADLSSVVSVDLDGNPRPTFNAFEMGAYEYLNPAGSVRVLQWNEKK